MTDELADVRHTPTDDPAADAWFRRAPEVASDGGRPEDEERAPDRDATTEDLADVSHTDGDHGEARDRLWQRGNDGDDDE